MVQAYHRNVYVDKMKMKALFYIHFINDRREDNIPVAKETCINELRTGRFYFRGKDKQGRPM